MTHHPDFSTYLQLVSFLVRAAQFTFQHYNFWNKYPLLTKFEVHTGGYGLHICNMAKNPSRENKVS